MYLVIRIKYESNIVLILYLSNIMNLIYPKKYNFHEFVLFFIGI